MQASPAREREDHDDLIRHGRIGKLPGFIGKRIVELGTPFSDVIFKFAGLFMLQPR
jgi:hypothetical protein